MALADYLDPTKASVGTNETIPAIPTAAPAAPLDDVGESISSPKPEVRYHRLSEARQAQGISLRNVARRLDVDVAVIRDQEDPTVDLPLSVLYQWQEILEVPIAELLIEENDPLSAPVLKRAQFVRLMKTVKAIIEQSKEINIQRLAQMMSEQMIQMMPELDEVTPWPSIGQYRDAKDFGQAAYRRFPDHINRRLED